MILSIVYFIMVMIRFIYLDYKERKENDVKISVLVTKSIMHGEKNEFLKIHYLTKSLTEYRGRCSKCKREVLFLIGRLIGSI